MNLRMPSDPHAALSVARAWPKVVEAIEAREVEPATGTRMAVRDHLPWGAKEFAEAAARYRRGDSLVEIARDLKRGYYAVQTYLRTRGAKREKGGVK